jgi:hypothetical protein
MASRYDHKGTMRLHPHALRTTHGRHLAALCAASAAMWGCGTQNATNTLIGAGDAPLPALVAHPPSSIPSEASPSVDGLDRRNWPVTAVQVPRGQVEVQPTYSENLLLASGTSRDGGAYPTTASSLDGRSDGVAVLAEAGAQPIWSAGWIMVGGPVRMMLGEPPWTVQRDPRSDFALDDPAIAQGQPSMWHWVSKDPATGASSPMMPARTTAVGDMRAIAPRGPVSPTPVPARVEP